MEHARCYLFVNEGDPIIYLSSADLMTRNLDKRIELMFPVENEAIRQRIQRDILFEIEDNTKAWIMQDDDSYVRAEPSEPRHNAQEANIFAVDISRELL